MGLRWRCPIRFTCSRLRIPRSYDISFIISRWLFRVRGCPWYSYQTLQIPSTRSIASIYAWTKGLAHRGKLDGNQRLVDWANTMETTVVNTVEAGQYTKDSAITVQGTNNVARESYLNTEEFLDAVKSNFDKVWK